LELGSRSIGMREISPSFKGEVIIPEAGSRFVLALYALLVVFVLS
jgi:hypothetical protein